jgi:hypothetical protein
MASNRLGASMSILKKLFGPDDDQALIYEAGSMVETIVTRFPLIRCHSDLAQAVIAKEAQNRDHTPIIIGSIRSVELLNDSTPRPTTEIALRAAKFDFPSWMDQAKLDWETRSEKTKNPVPPRGPADTHTNHADAIDSAVWDPARGAALQTIYIALFPTADPTEVPAYLDCGGWNAFPETEVHMGLMRRWRDRFGARLIGHSHDTLTFHVVRPPHTLAEALVLAEEHYAYCPDVVDQGFETLDALAGALLNAATWQFWWD